MHQSDDALLNTTYGTPRMLVSGSEYRYGERFGVQGWGSPLSSSWTMGTGSPAGVRKRESSIP